ncbi:MAG TPA: hypothetical protein VLG76_03135 [Rhabdochlamydiaceae bacterium]|nr:hypothetical protein [Rhabdochlamydiaceae bacterium]
MSYHTLGPVDSNTDLYEPFVEGGNKSGETESESRVRRACTAIIANLAKLNTPDNYRKVTLVLSAGAAYPITKLVLGLIAGAAITLTPANIVLLVAFAIFALITIAYLITHRNTLEDERRLDRAGFEAFKNTGIFATAPLSLPYQLIIKPVCEKRRARMAARQFEVKDSLSQSNKFTGPATSRYATFQEKT